MWVYLSFMAFSHLTQEQRNLCLTPFNESGQNFAATFSPNPESLCGPLPITPVCTHANGAALEVA
jgi:hypothetical protein